MKQFLFALALLPPLFAVTQPRFLAVKENLGPLVNDGQDQVLPVFSAQKQVLYFSQNTGPAETYEVWQSAITATGFGAKQRSPVANGPAGLHNYVFGAYPGGQLLINGRFSKTDTAAHAKGFSWYNPTGSRFSSVKTQTVEVEGLDALLQGRFANAFFHPGKRWLLLSFATGAKTDLWLCTPKAGEGAVPLRWNAPLRLPETLNTAGFDESCPYLDESGTVLYFSSNRPAGFGADDIYCSRLLDAVGQQWTPAQNLGFYVNSNRSELYYSAPGADGWAYFVSYKNSYGAGDIFRIRFAMEEKWATPPKGPAGPTAQPPASNPPLTQQLPTAPPVAQRPAPDTLRRNSPPLVITPEQLPPAQYRRNSLVLLLDISQSMRQGSKMNLLKKAADRLLTRLRYIDQVALVSFGERATMQYSTSALLNKDSMLNVLQNLMPVERETKLNPGLAMAYRHAIDNWLEEGNNEVMVITDGYFAVSQPSLEMIQKNPQIRLTFVLVDAGSSAANIVSYVQGRFPGAAVVEMSNENLDVNKLLETVKAHSAK